MLNLHQLRLFCVVAERGSISLAARELFMTPAALSVQLKRLEASLGVRLLHRGTRGVTVTTEGSFIYQLGQRVLQEERDTLHLAEQLRGGGAAFRIGATPAGAMYFVTEWLKQRPAGGPRVQLEIDAAQGLLSKLESGFLDLVADFGPHRWQKRFHPLLTETFVLLVSPRSPLAGAGVIDGESFTRLPFIAVELARGYASYVEAALRVARLRPNVQMRVPSIDAAKRCVEVDLGVTFAPRLSAWRELREGRLRQLSVEGFALQRELGLTLPSQQRTPRALAGLVQEIEGFAREWAAGGAAARE